MGLQIATRSTDLVDVVLALDPDIALANPPRPDGTRPLALYLTTGDLDVLEVPDTASVFTLRPLDRAEMRRADDAAYRVEGQVFRYRERDERAYAAVYDRVRALQVEVGIEAARAALSAERLALLGEPGTQEFEKRLTPSDGDAIRAQVSAIAKAKGTSTSRVLDALTDEEFAAYQRHSTWRGLRDAELVRRSVVRMTNPAIEAPAGPAGAGFPVERLLEMDGGEDYVHELAAHVVRVSRLGKAAPRSSGGSSGGNTPGAAHGVAPAQGSAAAGSTQRTEPA